MLNADNNLTSYKICNLTEDFIFNGGLKLNCKPKKYVYGEDKTNGELTTFVSSRC